jgi:hypothetical protein
MAVTVSGTSPDTGWYDGVGRTRTPEELGEWFARLRARGHGYLELGDDASPTLLAVSFAGDLAVVHLLAGDEQSFLLLGDGTHDRESVVEVPVMDISADFTGVFILRVDRAWEVAQAFFHGADPSSFGEWFEL